MSHFSYYSINASVQFGMFSDKQNTVDNWPPSLSKQNSYLDGFFFGLTASFNEDNGTFAEHAWFTIKYPTLHCLKAIHDTLTLNIRGGILHALAVPFSLIYHLVGLVTRSIATLFSGPQNDRESFYTEDNYNYGYRPAERQNSYLNYGENNNNNNNNII